MDTPGWVRNEAEWEDLCRQIVAVSTAVIRAQMSLTEGARLLAALSHEVRAADDPGFLTFIAIDSETDRFPVGEVRAKWLPSALPALDAERVQIESRFLETAQRASRQLLARYSRA